MYKLSNLNRISFDWIGFINIFNLQDFNYQFDYSTVENVLYKQAFSIKDYKKILYDWNETINCEWITAF